MRLELSSDSVQYIFLMRNSLDVDTKNVPSKSPGKSATVESSNNSKNKYCKHHVNSHKMSQRSTTQSSSSSYEDKAEIAESAASVHHHRSVETHRNKESNEFPTKNHRSYDDKKKTRKRRMSTSHEEEATDNYVESANRYTGFKSKQSYPKENESYYKSKRLSRKDEHSSSRHDRAHHRHSSRHSRRDSDDDVYENTQETQSFRLQALTRYSDSSALEIRDKSSRCSPDESPYKRQKRKLSSTSLRKKDRDNKKTRKHLSSFQAFEKRSENGRDIRCGSSGSRVNSINIKEKIRKEKKSKRLYNSRSRYDSSEEQKCSNKKKTQSPIKDQQSSLSSKKKKKESSAYSDDTTIKGEIVSPTECVSKKKDFEKKKKVLESHVALNENELPQKGLADEESRKHERLQRVRRLMEEKKRKKTTEVPIEAPTEAPSAPEISTLASSISSEGEPSTQEKPQEQTAIAVAPHAPLLDLNLAIKPEDLPLPYQGEYESYLQTVTEPDTLDDYMMTIETEMQELNFAPKKVRRKKKKGQQSTIDIAHETTAKSISLEEILKLQSEAAAISVKKHSSEQENLSSGGQTVSSLKELVSGENSLSFSPSEEKLNGRIEEDSSTFVSSSSSTFSVEDSTRYSTSLATIEEAAQTSLHNIVSVGEDQENKYLEIKLDNAVTLIQSNNVEAFANQSKKSEVDFDEEDYYRAFIAEVKRKQAEKESLQEAKGDELTGLATTENYETHQLNVDEKKILKRNVVSGLDSKKNRISIGRKNATQQTGKGGDELDDLDEEDYRYNLASEEDSLESYFDLAQKVGNRKELPGVDHSAIDYPSFQKNLYIQVREITLMKEHEVDSLRSLNGNIRVRGKLCPRPIKTFYQCGIPDAILKIVEKRDYEKPFPIQMQALPALMAGRDIIGIAETGSGKTLAYLLPVIRHMLAQPELKPGDGPIGLILAPTRELTVQIQREALKFCKAVALRSIAVYGGTGIGEQLSALKRGAELIVATPGRLIDVLTINNGKIVNLRRVTFCVLDEADRMFDMGFEPQITSILKNIRPDAQKALFSATFPPYIENLARKILRKPLEITVGERGQSAAHVEQFVEVWKTLHEKFLRLLQLLGEWSEHGSVIIFVSRQTEADELFAELLKYGYASLVLHGGQDQTDRDFTIQDFKDGAASILIATSVAARGLDVKSVVLVINYCAPDHLEDYIHRIGRTGRAGNIGVAYTFLLPEEGDKADDMIKVLKQHGKEVSSNLLALCDSYKLQCNMGIAKQHGKGGFGGKGFKFTPSEKSRQQQEQIRAKKELGLNESDEEDQYSSLMMGGGLDDFPEPSPQTPSTVVTTTTPATPTQVAPPVIPLLPPSALHGNEVDSASARAKALAELVVKQHTSIPSTVIQLKAPLAVPRPPTVTTASPSLALAQKSLALATQAAASLMGQTVTPTSVIRNTISPVFGLSQSSYIDQATGNIIEEFEINDYPQTARFKVTHKDILNRIADQSGAVLQVKGRYIPPEEKETILLTGVKKLYIEIIGTTPIIIQRAKHELRSFIEAVSMKQLNLSAASGRVAGRYSVV